MRYDDDDDGREGDYDEDWDSGCSCDPLDYAEMEERDVYAHMSARELEFNDRLDFARAVEEGGDPERAAEIRMGA